MGRVIHASAATGMSLQTEDEEAYQLFSFLHRPCTAIELIPETDSSIIFLNASTSVALTPSGHDFDLPRQAGTTLDLEAGTWFRKPIVVHAITNLDLAAQRHSSLKAAIAEVPFAYQPRVTSNFSLQNGSATLSFVPGAYWNRVAVAVAALPLTLESATRDNQVSVAAESTLLCMAATRINQVNLDLQTSMALIPTARGWNARLDASFTIAASARRHLSELEAQSQMLMRTIGQLTRLHGYGEVTFSFEGEASGVGVLRIATSFTPTAGAVARAPKYVEALSSLFLQNDSYWTLLHGTAVLSLGAEASETLDIYRAPSEIYFASTHHTRTILNLSVRTTAYPDGYFLTTISPYGVF